jgi:hypothetical protein
MSLLQRVKNLERNIPEDPPTGTMTEEDIKGLFEFAQENNISHNSEHIPGKPYPETEEDYKLLYAVYGLYMEQEENKL